MSLLRIIFNLIYGSIVHCLSLSCFVNITDYCWKGRETTSYHFWTISFNTKHWSQSTYLQIYTTKRDPLKLNVKKVKIWVLRPFKNISLLFSSRADCPSEVGENRSTGSKTLELPVQNLTSHMYPEQGSNDSGERSNVWESALLTTGPRRPVQIKCVSGGLWFLIWYHLPSLFIYYNYQYSGLSLSRNRRDHHKHFEISVLRHIRLVVLRKKQFEQPNFTNDYVIWLL